RSADSPISTGLNESGDAVATTVVAEAMAAVGYHAAMSPSAAPHNRLTLVVAAFNEADSLPLLRPRLLAALDDVMRRHGVAGGILYVDDGSTDATWQVMQELAALDDRVALLRLSRNFGKELALTAGLDRVMHGAALILDADGQDPPELAPEFVGRWLEGYDDVHGTRL